MLRKLTLLAWGSALLLPEFVEAAKIQHPVYQPLTLTFTGPSLSEEAENKEFEISSPFLDYRLEVAFTSPGGKVIRVPGFFAADGRAADSGASSGDKWCVRFTPAETGEWSWKVDFRMGKEVAVSLEPAGMPASFHGASGSFEATPVAEDASGFHRHGPLEYTGAHQLRHADGTWFYKLGAGSPETFLGYAEFDGTWWHSSEDNPIPPPDKLITTPLKEGLHHYEPHAEDWREGDPTWAGGRGKNIIGSVNYLAEFGMNSVYMLTMNVNGDGRNVWPWTGPWEQDKFDVSKLEQWNILFEHMDRLGIVKHFVLQEYENDKIIGKSGALNTLRKLYLREMVARFSHLNGIIWNLGEENGNSPDELRSYSHYLKALDPYDHPVLVHNSAHKREFAFLKFTPLLGWPWHDGISLQEYDNSDQTDYPLQWQRLPAMIAYWNRASTVSGRPWLVFGDELGGPREGLRTDDVDPDHDLARQFGLWGVLMEKGAGVSWYFGWKNSGGDSDLSAESWRTRERFWRQNKVVADLLQRIPYFEMQPDKRASQAEGVQVLVAPEWGCLVYNRSGGEAVLQLGQEPRSVLFLDPRSGKETRNEVPARSADGEVKLTPPDGLGAGDWAAILNW